MLPFPALLDNLLKTVFHGAASLPPLSYTLVFSFVANIYKKSNNLQFYLIKIKKYFY